MLLIAPCGFCAYVGYVLGTQVKGMRRAEIVRRHGSVFYHWRDKPPPPGLKALAPGERGAGPGRVLNAEERAWLEAQRR